MMASSRLTDIISAIWAASLVPTSVRRKLAATAVAVAMQQVPKETQDNEAHDSRPQLCPLLLLQECLLLVGSCMGHGMEGANVQQAKAWLRAAGHSSLAARLGKLSRLRNHAAHPDAGLLPSLKLACSGSIVGPGDVGRGSGVGQLDNEKVDVGSDHGTAQQPIIACLARTKTKQ